MATNRKFLIHGKAGSKAQQKSGNSQSKAAKAQYEAAQVAVF